MARSPSTQARQQGHRPVDRMAALAELVLPQQDLQQLLIRVAEVTSDLLPAYGASVILWDERSEAYSVSSTTVPGQQAGMVTEAVRTRGGATRWIIDHRKPLIVRDTADHEFGSGRLIDEHDLRAFVGFPLLAGGRFLGVLYALDRQPRDYPRADLDFLTILAHRAASAIDHARLLQELEQALTRTDALARVGHALMGQGHDLDGLLPRLAGIVAETIGASKVLLLMADSRRQRIDRFITAGSEAASLVDEGYESYRQGLTGWVLRHRQTAQSPAGVLDPRQRAEETAGRDSSRQDAIVVVPITDRSETAGTLTVIRSPERGDFDGQEIALLEAMAVQVSLAIAQARLHETLQRLATTDELTGLPNRRQLDELGRRAFARTRRHRRPCAVAMIDIDHFKRINDRHGHAAGDEVLREFAARGRSELRTIDIFGRYGGEEFALILPEEDLAGADTVAERLRRRVENTPFTTAAGDIEVTVTVGIAEANDDTASLDDLLERADTALYRGKEAGRNRVVADVPS